MGVPVLPSAGMGGHFTGASALGVRVLGRQLVFTCCPRAGRDPDCLRAGPSPAPSSEARTKACLLGQRCSPAAAVPGLCAGQGPRGLTVRHLRRGFLVCGDEPGGCCAWP